MKKLWFYVHKDIKQEATLTNLRRMINNYENVSLLIEKLDSNWFVEWSDSAPIRSIGKDTILGQWPYESRIPKKIRQQIEKVK